MAKDENRAADSRQDEQLNNQAERGGEKAAASEGESVSGAMEGPLEEQVNRMTPAEEAERQQAEAYPRALDSAFAGQHEEGPEEARQGHASTHRARVGRVVVVHEDVTHNGEVYKAGVQDIELDDADALIGEGKAYEPAGKKRGR